MTRFFQIFIQYFETRHTLFVECNGYWSVGGVFAEFRKHHALARDQDIVIVGAVEMAEVDFNACVGKLSDAAPEIRP